MANKRVIALDHRIGCITIGGQKTCMTPTKWQQKAITWFSTSKRLQMLFNILSLSCTSSSKGFSCPISNLEWWFFSQICIIGIDRTFFGIRQFSLFLDHPFLCIISRCNRTRAYLTCCCSGSIWSNLLDLITKTR